MCMPNDSHNLGTELNMPYRPAIANAWTLFFGQASKLKFGDDVPVGNPADEELWLNAPSSLPILGGIFKKYSQYLES